LLSNCPDNETLVYYGLLMSDLGPYPVHKFGYYNGRHNSFQSYLFQVRDAICERVSISSTFYVQLLRS